MDQKDKDRIAQRLRSSWLTEVIAEELDFLLADRPPDTSAEDYCAVIAELIANTFSQHMADYSKAQPPPTPSGADPTEKQTPSLSEIVQRLSVSVEHALLSGNLQMVRALGEAIAQRDTGSSKHNPRVTLYSVGLGEALGLSPRQIQALMKGAMLHDIGKIGIRDAVLLKVGDFSEQERRTMNRHPELGVSIIGGVKWLEDALDVVRHHHERFDGTGYPDRLIGDQIPLNARVFMVADVFDALTSSRPYKREFSYRDAIFFMNDRSGNHFDPEIVEAFCAISRPLYDELAWETYHHLDDKLQESISAHFNLGPKSTP